MSKYSIISCFESAHPNDLKKKSFRKKISRKIVGFAEKKLSETEPATFPNLSVIIQKLIMLK